MRTTGTVERTFDMPVRQLPANPNLAQLKAQAKDLLRAHRDHTPQAAQRIREFHPRFREASDETIALAALKLSDAQLTIARESGFSSWPRLKAFVEDPHRDDIQTPHHQRIGDAIFRGAVDLLDAGDAAGLAEYLRLHTGVVRQHLTFEGGNYFAHPALLEFIAENPTRHGRIPKNAPDVARVILNAGAKDDRAALDSALELVASSSVARESGVQRALIDVLCDYGADPNGATYAASLYGEFDAVKALVERGARVDLLVASALGLVAEAKAALADADGETRQRALAMAAQHGYGEIVRAILESGADPSRFAPVGGHSHATPLHLAALGGHLEAVKLLVGSGARTDLRDIFYDATPRAWAEHAGQSEVAEYLAGVGSVGGDDGRVGL